MAFQAAEIAGQGWGVFEDGRLLEGTQANAERIVAALNGQERLAQLEAFVAAARASQWRMQQALDALAAQRDADLPRLNNLLGAAPDILPPGVSSESAEKRSWER